MKQYRLDVEEREEWMGRVLLVYGTQLMAVPSFNDLGQMLSSSNNDWPAVEQNLWRVQEKWALLTKILGRE